MVGVKHTQTTGVLSPGVLAMLVDGCLLADPAIFQLNFQYEHCFTEIRLLTYAVPETNNLTIQHN